jgi:hypothetical protein
MHVVQMDAEDFDVTLDDGTVIQVTLRVSTRAGLGIRGVPPIAVVTEAVGLLEEAQAWPPAGVSTDPAEGPATGSSPVDVVGLVAATPGGLDELRARLV